MPPAQDDEIFVYSWVASFSHVLKKPHKHNFDFSIVQVIREQKYLFKWLNKR
jgi:hypothetical protein